MSADPQNIGYYYMGMGGLHLTGHNQIPFYGSAAAQMISNQCRFNSSSNNNNQELNDSGHMNNSQNYYIQPPTYSKNSLNQLNIGSNQGLCQHEDTDGPLGRSRGDSINFLPIPSANLDDNNFYPHNPDQIVSSNFQNELNPYNTPHSQSNLQPIGHSQQNYLIDDFQRSRNTPFNNFVPSHHTNLVGSCTVLPNNSNEMQYSYNYSMHYQYPPSVMQNSHCHNLNYLNSNYQLPMHSQQYLMNDISNHLPSQQMPQNNIHPHHYFYQNISTSLQNICYETEIAQVGVQDEKLSTFQQANDFQKSIASPQTMNKNKGYSTKHEELSEKNNVKNESDPSEQATFHLKSTEKVKRKYQENKGSCKKYDTKEEAASQDENIPVGQTQLTKRCSQTPKKKKSKTLSEVTTNFDQYSDFHTPTLKEHSYKKVKIEEKENQFQPSSSAEQSSAKTACSEQGILTPPKTGLLALPHDKLIENLKGIMKSLPPAYLPFLHKKQTDSQKLDYLKKHHHMQYQSDLNKMKQILPSNFIDYFDVSVESVYQNSYIMNGILQNMPDESLKKIGSLTKKERREKINKYKIKRDKRASCRKISYDVRKRVADSRLRVKGRFVTKEQALLMIGDTSGDIDKYTNQQLRELLFQKFGSENGERSKKLSMDEETENNILNLISLNYDTHMLDQDDDNEEEDREQHHIKK